MCAWRVYGGRQVPYFHEMAQIKYNWTNDKKLSSRLDSWKSSVILKADSICNRYSFIFQDMLRYFLLNLSGSNIRLFQVCEVQIEKSIRGTVRIEKSVRGSLFGFTRLCWVMPNSDPEGRIFLSAPNNHDKILFLAYLLISSIWF